LEFLHCPAPRDHTSAERAFGYAGPAMWNSLPADIQCTTDNDVNKDWTCKDKDQAYKDQDKDKD